MTAVGPHPGRGKAPQTVTGTGPDEIAALRDLEYELRGVDHSHGIRLEELRQRLRLAYVEGAEGWARENLRRGLTDVELGRVTSQYRGGWSRAVCRTAVWGDGSMAIDKSTLQSRRAVLSAAVAGGVATVAHALGQPGAVRAADGDPVVVGGSYSGTTETAIAVTGADAVAIHGTSPTGRAIVGTGGTGVWGEASTASGTGVHAINTNTSTAAIGLYAYSANGNGVVGQTVTGTGVSGSGSTGVGGTGSTTGVSGTATGGTGVHGVGLIGVHAAASSLGSVGLQVDGRAVFELSGMLYVTAGKDRVSSATELPIHPGSIVVAVVQLGDGKAWVRKVVPRHGSFTIILNKPVSRKTRVAWVAFG